MLIDPLDYLMSRPPGCAVTAMTPDGVVLLVREDVEGLRAYPSQCAVEVRLAAREIDDVLIIAFMCRLSGRDAGTFETWINPADPYQAQILASLAEQPDIDVHIHIDDSRPARSLRSPNHLRRGAIAIIEALADRQAWPMQAFDRAKAAWQREHPTVQALWASLDSPTGSTLT